MQLVKLLQVQIHCHVKQQIFEEVVVTSLLLVLYSQQDLQVGCQDMVKKHLQQIVELVVVVLCLILINENISQWYFNNFYLTE